MKKVRVNSKTLDARKAFQKYFNNQPNVITPQPVSFHMNATRDLFIEVSTGTGIGGEELYGVTVLVVKDGYLMRQQDADKCCNSLHEADQYTSDLLDLAAKPKQATN